MAGESEVLSSAYYLTNQDKVNKTLNDWGFGTKADSADVQAMKSSGMTSEYLGTLDDQYKKRFGRGMPGEVFGQLHGSRSMADQMTALLQMSDEDLAIQAAKNSGLANKLKQWNMITESQLNDAKAAIKEATKVEIPAEYQALMDQYLKEANVKPEMNYGMVEQWLPKLQEQYKPLVDKQNKSMNEYMNNMGMLFSGQTIDKSNEISQDYNTQALQKALGYAEQDYAQQQSNKSLAGQNYLNLMNQATNRKWNVSDADLARAFQLSNQATTRDYAKEDYSKMAELYASMNKNTNTGFDWTKMLQPIATTTAALI